MRAPTKKAFSAHEGVGSPELLLPAFVFPFLILAQCGLYPFKARLIYRRLTEGQISLVIDAYHAPTTVLLSLIPGYNHHHWRMEAELLLDFPEETDGQAWYWLHKPIVLRDSFNRCSQSSTCMGRSLTVCRYLCMYWSAISVSLGLPQIET